MDPRKSVVIGLAAGAGLWAWWLTRRNPGAVYAPIDLEYGGLDLAAGLSPANIDVPGYGRSPGGDYYSALSRAEDPTQDPWAKNPYSTASGLYQFTMPTWTALGGDWGDDPSKAFGGLRPSPEAQRAMAEKLTAGNASILERAGVGVNNLTHYAAHIFNPKKAARVLAADPSTPLASLVGASTVKKNPALGSTVASFTDYLVRKVG